jgi:hypothetical protein
MVSDVSRLRAVVFERAGIAIDEKDPIMGVLVACAYQTEEVGARLLAQASPLRAIVITAAAVLFSSLLSVGTAWHVAQADAAAQRLEWIRQQRDPRIAALIASDQGRAGLRLAELGVAKVLSDCTGRRSWRMQQGYCIPMSSSGQPDGFKVSATPEARPSR